jgi:TPR repeat protein
LVKASALNAALVKASALNDDRPDWRGKCAICLDVLPDEARTQRFYECCSKKICTQCSTKCLQHDTRCPLCRAPLAESNAEWLRRLQTHVDKGDAEAQSALGQAHHYGEMSLAKNLERAFQLYVLAAAQGKAPAQLILGQCYAHGHGVEIDYKTAALWYRRAAEQGHPIAQCSLGNLFYNGEGVAQSDDEAARWYRLAAAQGNTQALCDLGVCHANGEGVPQDCDEAMRCFKRAAAQGSAKAAATISELEAYLAATRPR